MVKHYAEGSKQRHAGTKVFSALMVMALAGLAACNAGPELRIEHVPQASAVIGSVRFLPETSDEIAAKAVSEVLVGRYGIDAGSEWQGVVTLAVRPAEIGTASDVVAREGVWTETPRIVGARRGAALHVLTVALQRQDGSDPRVASVSARDDTETTSQALLELLAAAAAELLVEGQLGAD